MIKKIQESHRLAYKTNDYETQENYRKNASGVRI
jgi:hypothetical protein